MQAFSVTLDFELKVKPYWLDKFRKKYDDPVPYHITLKQKTYLKNGEVEDIEKELNDIALNYSQIKIIFNDMFINQTPKGHVIMLRASHNHMLLELQGNISKQLSKYGEIIKSYTKDFEANFDPHITIARHLTQGNVNKAKLEIVGDIKCTALVEEIVLNVASSDINSFDFVNPKYKTKFKLISKQLVK